MTNKDNQKGQILVITLLVILILSIIVMSTVVNLSRDVKERVNNQIYEQNYTIAESRLYQTSEFFDSLFENSDGTIDGNLLIDLENKLSTSITGQATSPDCNNIATQTSTSKVVCIIKDGDISTEVSIEQKNNIEDFEMTSNDVLQLNLTKPDGSDYQGMIRWNWIGSVKWSITLVYERIYEGATYTESVKDFYDGGATNGNGAPAFTFSNYSQSVPRLNGVMISNISSLSDAKFNDAGANRRLLYLRLRPIISGAESTNINLNGDADLPIQFLDMRAQSFVGEGDNSTPTPLLSIKKPLVPAPPAIFDYVYYTNQSLNAY